MDVLQLVAIPLLTAILAAGATAVYFRYRTRQRILRLKLIIKNLAQGEPVELGRQEPPELVEAVEQLAQEIKGVVQGISAERNTMAALLQNMSDGIISTDAEGRITNINQSARNILGMSAEVKPEGRPFMQVVRDYEVNTLLRQTLADGQERVQQLELGSRRPQLQVKVTLIQEEVHKNGMLPDIHNRTALVVLQDLTEILRLERIRRDFVANISHELRTPLASVKLMIETLQSVIEDDPTAAPQFLVRIDTEIDGLTQLVRELLELSRIESGQIKLNFKSTDLRELVEQAAERLKTQAARRGLSIQVSRGSEEAFPNALADPDRLMQVLINLIHNAIKFTPIGGTITLSVERQRIPDVSHPGQRLIVRVSDTGVGIPPDEIARIFERFYKVDKARAGNEGGTGLGLAIAKHIIQAHGGEIWVESEFNAGSCFSFTIPIFPLS